MRLKRNGKTEKEREEEREEGREFVRVGER